MFISACIEHCKRSGSKAYGYTQGQADNMGRLFSEQRYGKIMLERVSKKILGYNGNLNKNHGSKGRQGI